MVKYSVVGPDVISNYHTYALVRIQITWISVLNFEYYGAPSEGFRKASIAQPQLTYV